MRIAALSPPILGLSILTLAACGAAGSKPVTHDGPCGNVQPILDARSEAEPFTSLRGKNRMLGEHKLPDSFEGRHEVFGKACSAKVMNGFSGDSKIYTYSCILFEGNSMDRTADKADAEAAFDEAADEMKACLGDGWETAEDTESMDFDVYHKITYSPADLQPSATGFTADPAYLEMSYTPFMRGRGGASGWQVLLQFQEQVDGED